MERNEALSTTRVARAASCSAQQVRDLEAAGVIPRAERAPNGYRRFTQVHVDAIRAYRLLAAAVGPTTARDTMRDLAADPADAALARIGSLHVDLALDRERTLLALEAVGAIREEPRDDDAELDAMTITQLAEALGVRPSTLRFWELEGLVRPTRRGRLGARSYPADAVREARIVSALRTSGRSIPATARVMADLRDHGGVDALHTVLAAHLEDVARRTEHLLRAGTSLVELRAALTGR